MRVDARWEVLRTTALFRGVLAPLVLRNGPMWQMPHGRYGAYRRAVVAEYERRSAESRVAGSPGMGVDARWEVLRPTALIRGVLVHLVLQNGHVADATWPFWGL